MMRSMYGIKVVNAQQAKFMNNYTKIKFKLLKTNTSVWFDVWCKALQLTPKYAQICVQDNDTRLHSTSVSFKLRSCNRWMMSAFSTFEVP